MHDFIVKTTSGHSVPRSQGLTNPRAFSPRLGAGVGCSEASAFYARSRRHVAASLKLIAPFIEHFAIHAEAVRQAAKPHDTVR
jgi:hypothetical protein